MSLDDELRGAAAMSRSNADRMQQVRERIEANRQTLLDTLNERTERREKLEEELDRVEEQRDEGRTRRCRADLRWLNGEIAGLEIGNNQFLIALRGF